MPPSFFNDLFQSLANLMTENSSAFESVGNQMYTAFAGMLMIWFGIKVALRGHEFPMERFASMLMTIAFGLAMIRFYSTPIPGFGISFYHLVIDEGAKLAQQLNGQIVTRVTDRLTLLYASMEPPGISAVLNFVECVRWLVTVLAIAAAMIATYLVIAWGYIAVAVCVLVGPIFIPFFIVPSMEWMFWGWFRAILQYSFYPVVANAYVYVFGSLLINFVDRVGAEYTGAKIAAMFLPLVFVLIAYTWGILKVPSFCNSLFTGKAGEFAMPSFS